ncbi:hypothetical protein [Candidatus Harpocratesius sp.]
MFLNKSPTSTELDSDLSNLLIYTTDISGDAPDELKSSTLSVFRNINISFYEYGIILNNDFENIFHTIQLVPSSSQSISEIMEIMLTGGYGEIDHVSIGEVNISNYLYWNFSQFNNDFIKFSSHRFKQFLNNSIMIQYDPSKMKYIEYYSRENGVVEQVIVNCKTNFTESIRIKIINTEFDSKYINSWNFDESYLGIRQKENFNNNYSSLDLDNDFFKWFLLIAGIGAIGWVLLFIYSIKKRNI